MGKIVAVLLIVAALAAEVAFLLTGAGQPKGEPGALAEALGPQLAGSPSLAAGGAVAFVLGVMILGRARDAEPFALREVCLVLSVALAAALTAALFLGVAREWTPRTLAVLGGGALLELLAAVGVAIRLALTAERRKLLFVPGLLGTLALAGLYVFLLVQGTA